MPRRSDNRVPLEDPFIYLPKALTKLHSIWLRLTYPFASLGRNLSIHFTCRLHRSRAHRIKIGSSVCMGKGTWINVSATKTKGEPVIVLDDKVCIGPRVQISGKNHIHIERGTLIASSVLIQDHNHGYEDITMPIAEQPITEGGRIRIGEGSLDRQWGCHNVRQGRAYHRPPLCGGGEFSCPAKLPTVLRSLRKSCQGH